MTFNSGFTALNTIAFADGTALAPGSAFSSEISLGFYRSSNSNIALSYGSLTIPGLMSAAAGATITGSDVSVAAGVIFTANRANPSTNVAAIYNQSSVGPTISGNAFDLRTGS